MMWNVRPPASASAQRNTILHPITTGKHMKNLMQGALDLIVEWASTWQLQAVVCQQMQYVNYWSCSLWCWILCVWYSVTSRDTVVPAEGNGYLQTLTCPCGERRCPTLSNPVPWQNWMAAYLGYTLWMKTLFRSWPVMVQKKKTTNRDLGIVIAQDLAPSIHIREITAKAHQRANCILRSFVSKDINLLMRAFIVYVRPIVEYCSVVWSSSLKKDTELIEKVQCRFTKRLPGLKHMSYNERLHYLRLSSLELWRLHLDLICCYKIVFGVVDLNFSDFLKFSSVTAAGAMPTNCTSQAVSTVLALCHGRRK